MIIYICGKRIDRGSKNVEQRFARLRIGFTLVELLISISIISFLSVVVFNTFSQGLRLWRQVLDANSGLRAALYLEKVTEELRNGLIYSGKTLVGDPRSLAFYSIRPGKWSSADKSGSFFEGPVQIRYAFDADRKNLYGWFSRAGAVESGEEGSVELDQLIDCRYSFYKGDANLADRWVNYWQDQGFPCAVKVLIQYKEKGIVRTASKVIPIPSSGCTV